MFSLLLLVTILLAVFVSRINGQTTTDNSDEYVRQVLEEERQHYYSGGDNVMDDEYVMYQEYDYSTGQRDDFNEGNGGPEEDEETIRQRQQQAKAEQIQMEEERRAQEQADKLAAQRERQFQSELDRMNEEQRKAALRQKRKDKRRVQAVLKAAKHNDLYGVLGLNNWTLKTNEIRLKIPGIPWGGLVIPSITIKETTDKDIRRSFRTMSKLVHPDKNRDGHATEAFIAVEEAAAVLGDPTQRAAYDEERRRQRSDELDSKKHAVTTTVRSFWNVSAQTIKTTKTVLGPFATPVFIIAFLIA